VWFERRNKPAVSVPPEQLTLRELIATQPRLLRGSLTPGERFPTGMRPGRRRAQGMDLDSIGPYTPGDDVRWMDWRATARTGRAQMKRFVAESHIARMLIVDMRAHMFFATRHYPLAKTAALSAARLCWEALSLHEPVGLIVLPLPEIIQPRRGRSHIFRILNCLEESYRLLMSRPQDIPSAWEPAAAVENAAMRLYRGDEICVISDFGEADAALAAAAANFSEIRKLCALIIEDAIFFRPLPGGRYPLQQIDGSGRYNATIPSGEDKDKEQPMRIAAEIRQALQLKLARAGWKTYRMSAADFLPRDPHA
jgi:hypothetical protein